MIIFELPHVLISNVSNMLTKTYYVLHGLSSQIQESMKFNYIPPNNSWNANLHFNYTKDYSKFFGHYTYFLPIGEIGLEVRGQEYF